MEIHRRGHCVLDSQPNKIKLRIQYDRCSGLISRLYRGHSVNDSFEMPGRELYGSDCVNNFVALFIFWTLESPRV